MNCGLLGVSFSALKSPGPANEILPPEYSAVRKDRDDGYGGVIIIYKRSLIVEEIHHHKSTEIVSIKLETKNNPTIISSCYRPPNCSLQTNESLTNEINALCKKFKNNPIWIGGDFNLPDIDWMTNSIISHKNSTEVNQLYLDTFENRNLVQIVDFTTRVNSLLDLVLTNRPGLLVQC